jgi:pimeloyl-ACP methyl ester carboxylesterase
MMGRDFAIATGDSASRNLAFVCLHGIGGAPSDWASVTARLSALGDVVCVDVPGDSLAIASDRVIEQLPTTGDIVLVGHSRGGVLALMVAASRPERVTGLILSGGYVPPNRAERSWIIGTGSWIKHRARLVHRFVRGGHLRTGGSDGTASFRSSLPVVAQLAGVGLRPSAFDRVAQAVQCPVLAISGDRDSHVPASWTRGAARRYGWTLAIIRGDGHFSHTDQPGLWADAVEAWLAG